MTQSSLLILLFSIGCSGAGGDDTSSNPQNPLGAGPAAVDLGNHQDPADAGGYLLLAKSGISNVTGSSLSGGDVGLSPAAATFLTGFSLVQDPSDEFATSSSVVAPGKVYAADFADPTPTQLTSAVLVMETAYTDAMGRSPPDELNLSSGNLGGLTLAPGLYTWGSSVTIATDLTLDGGADDTWIFQISDDLDLSTATSVILSGGAQAGNVFWVLAGQATVHADAHMEGVILSKTGITLQTNASLNGRAMAQTMIALDDNAVTAP